jgi:hypothetical protein
MLAKLYGETAGGEKRYCLRSAWECARRLSLERQTQRTFPSYTEKHSSTRTAMRRFTRLNAFSKRIDNHCHALALYFVWHNFVWTHKAHRVWPATATGLTDKLMDMINIGRLTDEYESWHK